MNWFSHPEHLCSTIDMDTQDGLVEAMMIAISHIKDDEGKFVRIRLGSTPKEDLSYLRQVADTLLTAKKIRDERQLQQE
jgi:hypothetical protein